MFNFEPVTIHTLTHRFGVSHHPPPYFEPSTTFQFHRLLLLLLYSSSECHGCIIRIQDDYNILYEQFQVPYSSMSLMGLVQFFGFPKEEGGGGTVSLKFMNRD